jgi:prophage antirepressor-like protein
MTIKEETMPNLIPFQFNGEDIVTIQDEHGELWWKASDVCQQCGIKNVSQACERLDADEKNTICLTEGNRGNPETLIVNEAGLYALGLRSRKPEAKVFKRWVTHEVLPAIRKTGSYGMPTVPQVRDKTLQMIIDMAVQLDEARILAEEAKAEAVQAQSTATRALESQLFFTVAEYIYINKLQAQLPEASYKACSDHLRLYCMDRSIPFRKVLVGGKRWENEYSYHVSVYVDALPGWLSRRFAQGTLHALDPRQKGRP